MLMNMFLINYIRYNIQYTCTVQQIECSILFIFLNIIDETQHIHSDPQSDA